MDDENVDDMTLVEKLEYAAERAEEIRAAFARAEEIGYTTFAWNDDSHFLIVSMKKDGQQPENN